GGPIAVIAASRISHPYPNALLGQGISEPFFDPKNRVGDAFRAGTKSMLASSRGPTAMLAGMFLSKAVDGPTLVRDHVYIYNLLGDPAQKVPVPAGIPPGQYFLVIAVDGDAGAPAAAGFKPIRVE